MAGTKLFLCTEVVVPVVPLSESDCVDVIGVDRYLFTSLGIVLIPYYRYASSEKGIVV